LVRNYDLLRNETIYINSGICKTIVKRENFIGSNRRKG